MSAESVKRKRIYLINRDFQMRYTKIAVVVGLLTTVLTSFRILYPMFQFKIIRGWNFIPLPFFIAMATAALINFGIIAGLGILITHKMAGPMFSLVRQMRRIRARSFDAKLTIRKADDMRYVVRNFNDLVDELVLIAKEDSEKVEEIIAGMKNSDYVIASERAHVLLSDIRSRLEGIEND